MSLTSAWHSSRGGTKSCLRKIRSDISAAVAASRAEFQAGIFLEASPWSVMG